MPFWGTIYKLRLYNLIIPSIKGDLYDTTVGNYNIFITAVPYCGNDYGQDESSAEQECGVSIPCSQRL